MDLIQFQKLFKKEPRYRLRQAKKGSFSGFNPKLAGSGGIALRLREELNKKCPIEISAKTFVSKDKNTIKALIILKDGLKIETVLMRHQR